MQTLVVQLIGVVAMSNIVLAAPSATENGRQAQCVAGIATRAAKVDDLARRQSVRMSTIDHRLARAQLAMMGKTDQAVRKAMLRAVAQCGSGFDAESLRSIITLMQSIDRKNLSELKELLKKIHWPVISKYGAAADQAAFLVVQHAADDAQFQRDILDVLQSLVQRHETSSENYALLYDRVQENAGRLQLYGSQGECVGHKWTPTAIDDPLGVDKRRAAIGLPKLSAYTKRAAKLICGAQ